MSELMKIDGSHWFSHLSVLSQVPQEPMRKSHQANHWHGISSLLIIFFSSSFPSSGRAVFAGCGNQRVEGGESNILLLSDINIQYLCLYLSARYVGICMNSVRWILTSSLLLHASHLLRWSPEQLTANPWKHCCRKLKVSASSLVHTSVTTVWNGLW